jgi:TP901 family phage tail tape measure protein
MSNPVVLRFLADTKQLDRAWAKVQADSSATDRALKKFGGFSEGATKVGTSLTHWITLPVLAAGVAAGKLAMDYQAAMAKVQGLTNQSAGQTKAWSGQILQLAGKLPIGPNELADALYYVASAGLKGKAAMDVVTASAKASAAGLGSVHVVADAVTSALNSYGVKNLSASAATDVLVATVREGKMTAEDLAGSLGKIISPAQILGVHFNELGAGIASMTHLGLSSAEAVTALRGIFTTIIKPASGAAKEMAKFGMSADGLRKEIKEKGLLATLETMRDKAHGNIAVFGKMIPNVRALNGFLAMMKTTNTQTADIFERMSHTAGSTDKAFATVAQTTKFKLGVALNDLKVMAIQVGNDLLPEFDKIASAVSKLTQKFQGMSPETRKSIEHMAGLAAAMGPVIFTLGKLGKGLTAIAKHPIITMLVLLAQAFIYLYTNNKKFHDGVNQTVSELGHFLSIASQNKKVIDALGIAMAVWGTVVTVQTGIAIGRWVALKVAQITSMAETAALRAMYAADFVREQATMMAVGARTAISQAATSAKSMAETAALRAMYAGQWIAEQARTAAFSARTAAAWVAGQIRSFATVAAARAVDAGRTLAGYAVQGAAAARSAAVWVAGQLSAFATVAAARIVAVAEWVAGQAVMAASAVASAAAAAAAWVVANIAMIAATGGILLAIGALVAAGVWIYKNWDSIWAEIQKITAVAAKWIWDHLYLVMGLILGPFGLAVAWILKHWTEVWAGIQAVFSKVVNFITALFNTWTRTMAAIWQTLSDLFTGHWSRLWSDVQNILQTAIGGLGSAISGLAGDALGWLVQVGQNIVQGLVNGITGMTSAAVGAVKGVGSSVVSGLKSLLGIHSPSRVMYEIGTWTWKGLANGISDGEAGVTHSMTSVMQKAHDKWVTQTIRLNQAKARLAATLAGHTATQHHAATKKHGAYDTYTHIAPTAAMVLSARQAVANAQRAASMAYAAFQKAMAAQNGLNARRSAGKPLLGLADMLTAGLGDELNAGQGPVSRAATQLAAAIKRQFSDANGKVPVAVQTAMTKLSQLSAKAGTFRGDFFKKVLDHGDFIAKFGSNGATSGDIKAFLSNEVTQMGRLSSDLTILAKRGVPGRLIQQLAAGGLDALPMADTLAHSSKGDLADILRLQAQVQGSAVRAANVTEVAAFGGASVGAMAPGAVGGSSTTVNVNVNSNANPHEIASEIAWNLKTAGA